MKERALWVGVTQFRDSETDLKSPTPMPLSQDVDL